jgi:hypothetical protein
MASSILPEPGSTFGPCKKCNHKDCNQTRAEAASLCRFCQKPIEFNVSYYVDPQDRAEHKLVHATCLEESVERKGYRQ